MKIVLLIDLFRSRCLLKLRKVRKDKVDRGVLLVNSTSLQFVGGSVQQQNNEVLLICKVDHTQALKSTQPIERSVNCTKFVSVHDGVEMEINSKKSCTGPRMWAFRKTTHV